jgi:hypothetical protein
MSTKPSLLWSLALPVSLLILAAAYYVKIPSARAFIDAHTSLGRDWLGRFVAPPQVIEVPSDKPPAYSGGPGAVIDPSPKIAPAPISAAPEPFSLQKLAGDPAHWPKKVVLKKAVTFPAVVNGKVIGNLIAPAGAEANLKAIRDGKVGVEYQGGGAWLAIEDTDLVARATSGQ